MINEINIDKIVRERAGKKAKFIPKWLTGLLARIIHQEFINIYLRRGRVGVDFCKGVVEYVGANVTVEGKENLPDDGRLYTFVSNHPLGAIDGVTLGWIIGEHYGGKIKYLVNDLLMNVKGLAPMCVPINKLGAQARDLPRLIDDAFNSGNHMIIFPAGICSRKVDGKIQDLPWGKAFITKSVLTGRHIVPVHFIGQNSPRFYRIDKICKALKIKFNIPMLFLPDEMVRGMHGTYTVKIGKPIPPEHFDSSKSPKEWAEWLRQLVYTI